MRQPVKPRQWWEDEAYIEASEPRSMVVDEPARDDWSGLYDAKGNKLMRPRQKFGFRVRD